MTMTKVKAKTLLDVRKNYFLRTFLWGLGLAFLIFIPWMIMNDGYFFFYGDFNVQQIPFYQMIHDSIWDGNLGWSYTTDLGANIIGSYSFYMLGSPFFWLTMLFPSKALPYMMAPLLMLKFAFAALAAYTFLRRYVQKQNYAVIGALLYAFSGFGIYNVFFNHFHEAMITFPYLLAAVDEFVYEKRKGAVALAVFAACFVNYYFFAGQAVFVFIYWCFRMITGSFRMKLSEFLRFAFEVIIGFLASAVLLIPSILSVIQNSRVNNAPEGWGALTYSSEQRYVHILSSFFFPPDMPAYANFTPDSNAKWASVAAWLPLFSMVGVFSFFKLKTHKWLRVFLPTLFVIAFVPLFNSIFQLLNASYYARWFYMLTLMMSLATVITLDHTETDFKWGMKLTFIITSFICVLIGLMPTSVSEVDGVKQINHGLENYPDRFWVWSGLALFGLVALAVVFNFRKKQKLFMRLVSVALSIMIVVYGNVLLGTGVVNAGYQKEYMENYALGNKDAFDELTDLHQVRSDFHEEMDNMGMFWQIPTIQAFQSIVPGSIMDFYPTVGVERSVGSRPNINVYGIRALLSVKYVFDNQDDSKNFMISMRSMKMPGWKYLKTKNGYKVFENEYFIPYGFTYDSYITAEEYDECEEKNRHLLLLKDMVLSKEQAKKYKKILKHDENLKEYNYTHSEYYRDCNARKALTCSSVQFENNRFTAEITTGNSGELVFFSIPYEKGWSATVNGQSVDIEKVNVGFMAVEVPANKTSQIVFTYQTPGLLLGAGVTGVSVVIFTVYMVIWKAPKKRKEEGLYLIDDLAPEFETDKNDDAAVPQEILDCGSEEAETVPENNDPAESIRTPESTSVNQTDDAVKTDAEVNDFEVDENVETEETAPSDNVSENPDNTRTKL